jgi:hypothetical protein
VPAPLEYRIVVAKQARQLGLWSGSGLERTYVYDRVAIGMAVTITV